MRDVSVILQEHAESGKCTLLCTTCEEINFEGCEFNSTRAR